MDSGAQLSVIPPSVNDRYTPSKGSALQAVKGSSICTFCTHIMPIVIGDRHFSWEFVIADVSQPLLGGGDFLCTNGLILDLKGHRLIDTKSYAIIPLTQATQVGPRIRTVEVQAGGAFSDLL